MGHVTPTYKPFISRWNNPLIRSPLILTSCPGHPSRAAELSTLMLLRTFNDWVILAPVDWESKLGRCCISYPRCAVHVWNIYLHEWPKFMVNVGKYYIHGAYGYKKKPFFRGHSLVFRGCIVDSQRRERRRCFFSFRNRLIWGEKGTP